MTALLIAGALLLRAPALAEAHTVLLSSQPAAGSHLASAPSRIRLLFSEPLEVPLTRVALVTEDGRSTPLPAAGDPHDVHAIVATPGVLPAGAYRVVWRVVSADGHPVAGSFVFSVGSPPIQAVPREVVPPAELSAPTWGPTFGEAPALPALLRGLAVGTAMALAGLLLFLSWSGEPRAATHAGAWRLANGLAVAGALLLALHLVAWLANAIPEHRLGQGAALETLSTRVGQVELWRAGLGLLALWALLLARRPRLALVFAAGVLLVSGASGHSAAIDPFWATPAKALHLLAGGAWLGGLLWLLVLDPRDTESFAAESGRVSAVALGAVLLVTLSGVVQGFLFVPAPLDLVRSAYGLVLLAKVAGLLILVGFGVHHRYRGLPALGRDATSSARFRSTLRGEVVVMAVVVLLGGLLAYLPAPPSPHADVERAAATSHAAAP